MKTLTLSPICYLFIHLYIYLFIFSGHQMQYPSAHISACDVTFLVSRQVMAQCDGMIISQDLQTGVSDFAG